MLSVISWVVLAAVILAQAFVTERLWRSEMYSRDHKLAQSVLIWLLPIVGAIVVYAGLRQDDDVSRPTPNTEREYYD
ncbi:hypothetical protein WMF04_05635 [Sorangium sp. So ce260]|uniref:hypothetical protein n=1 Tax=Sorangium sp. So ce260 TaxID=3133291 RepID=UPI003F5FDEE9